MMDFFTSSSQIKGKISFLYGLQISAFSLNFKNSVKDGLLPLLDRESEMTVFRRSLDDLKKGSNPPEGLLIVGEPKIGKSRLLDEMIIEAINQRLNPVIVGLRLGHSFLAYAAAVHFLCHVRNFSFRENDFIINSRFSVSIKKTLKWI